MVERTAEEYVNTYIQFTLKLNVILVDRCLFHYDFHVIIIEALMMLRNKNKIDPMHSQCNDDCYLHALVPFKCCPAFRQRTHKSTGRLHDRYTP